MSSRLQDRRAIVTGAGRGFGEGIARLFAAEGASVLVADIDGATAGAVAEDITAHGGKASACTVDVSRSEQVKAMMDAAVSAFGGVDVLVNNAGTTHRNQPMLQVDEDTFDRVFAVNVKSIYLGAVHGIPLMQPGAVIINVASTAGVRPRPGLTWYNATKGAAITMTRSMAVELAPQRIRVVAVNPVVGDTPLLERFLPGEDTPEARQRFIDTIPLGRMSTPADVAKACLFLASDDAEFLTGLCMDVDGGRCI